MSIKIKSPPRPRLTGPKRLLAWLALAVALVFIMVGVPAMCLGGYVFLSLIFGHADELAFPWWPFFPGIFLFFAGGAIGHMAADALGWDR